MTETETPEYLTLREYADAIGKSHRTVQRQLANGEITSDKKLPGATAYSRSVRYSGVSVSVMSLI